MSLTITLYQRQTKKSYCCLREERRPQTETHDRADWITWHYCSWLVLSLRCWASFWPWDRRHVLVFSGHVWRLWRCRSIQALWGNRLFRIREWSFFFDCVQATCPTLGFWRIIGQFFWGSHCVIMGRSRICCHLFFDTVCRWLFVWGFAGMVTRAFFKTLIFTAEWSYGIKLYISTLQNTTAQARITNQKG